MKILCSLSGLEFNCEHFPGTFYSRETTHPIFHVPQARLIPYIEKWAAGELTQTDSYLLLLALLNSSDLIDFRTAVYQTEQTASIIAQNMEATARAIIRINTVHNASTIFPKFVISPETRNLSTLKSWLDTWADCYADFLSGYKSTTESSKLIAREQALEKLIRSQHKPIESYSGQLGEWAAIAGRFPTYDTPNTIKGITTTLASYWKSIINKCARNETLHGIPSKDIAELLDHCETEIPSGSIYSSTLFKLLRTALTKQQEYLGLDSRDLKTVTYSILSADNSAEAKNIVRLIDAAPKTEPQKSDYPTKFAYFQAKLRWDMAQQVKKANKPDEPDAEEI